MAPTPPKSIGRYDVIELVGRGGMGVLYRAHDPMLQRDVALKMMHVDFTGDDTARERFQREARAVARLQHKNVVTIHELGEVEGTPFIVMEFLSGRDLEALLKDNTSLTLQQKLEIAIQLHEGLGYAHDQGIVHRDIKPGNVRVLEDNSVKILDFGIAKFAMSSVTQSGTVMGTPSYMAPEQIMGQAVDGRADLFSSGVLLYELLSGKKPFVGDSPTSVVYQIMHGEATPIREVVPDLPEALSEVVGRALQKKPEDRYARASEIVSDLQTIKVMLDMPLNQRERTGGQNTSTGDTTTMMPPLHATIRRTPTGATGTGPVSQAKMRESAVEMAADAAPRGRVDQAASKSSMMLVAGAAVVMVLGAVGYFAIVGRGAASNGTAVEKGGGGAGGASGSSTTPAAAVDPTALTITSVPKGAKISLNGADTGKVTPAEIALGKTAPAALELTLRGFKPFTASLTADDVKAGAREYKLVSDGSVSVQLSVSAPYPFEIVQGSQVVSEMAAQHEMAAQPGARLVARNKDMLLSVPINVDAQRAKQDVTLPAAGLLNVFAANETCTVVIDGQDLGNPPIPRKPVGSGKHTVVLKCPDGKQESRSITVAAGKPLDVAFR